ncbi:MAG: DNA-directed RNA polymerase subunit alpha [Dehalococcoidia bacterium]|nr:DNA-directed RNA polymerase subunit alpha [Dehalococcoidia bacterium]
MSPLIVPKIEAVESKGNYAKFKAEPLGKGIGITLGNALRRMLLGYLPGAAVTSVKIEGIQHEFSTIPNVKEDTIEFLLNVKSLRLKANSGRPGKLVLEVAREGGVTAADIKPSEDFEIINPDLYLATLDSPDARLSVEFNVELGEGYRQADGGTNLSVGVIPVDAVFTPIRKVNFAIEPVHLGRETSRERLNLEIWTDGTVSPVDAVSHSAEMLMQLLAPFAGIRTRSAEEVKVAATPAIPDEKINMLVEDMDLSVRTLNSLRRGGISTVGELVSKSEKELLQLRNFGQKSMQEVQDRLKAMGLTLAGLVVGEAEKETSESVPEEQAE